MKRGWEMKKLGDLLFENKKSKIQVRQALDKGKFLFFTSGLKTKWANSFLVQGENIFVATGGKAVISYYDGKASYSTDAYSIRALDGIAITKFLYYFIQSNLELIEKNMFVGAAIKHLQKKDFKNIDVKLPSLQEQKRIVAILDEAFTAIDKAKNIAKQNLENSKELFEAYLDNAFQVKDGRWEIKTLGEIAEVEYGYTDKSTSDGDYRYVRITDIDKNGELIMNDKKYIKKSKKSSSFVLNENDLLMARTGATFAKVLLYKDFEPSVFASYLIKIKFTEKVENKLYWYFTKTKNYWEQANSLSSGAAQPHFNGAAVKQVIFSYPRSVKEQKQLIKKFNDISSEIRKLETVYLQKINDLEALKKAILQKAFSGEL